MGAETTGELSVRRLAIRDAAGHVRAELTTDENGEPMLRFCERDGSVRLMAGMAGGGNLLQLMEPGGRAVTVSAVPGVCGVMILDAQGEPQVMLNAGAEGCSLLLCDSHGPRATLSLTSLDGRAALALHDGEGRVRFQASVSADGKIQLLNIEPTAPNDDRGEAHAQGA